MGDKRRRRPATTPEGRETQLIADAYNLAERQLIEGSASAQVITHFLKAGSTRDALERRKIEQENLMMSARIEEIASRQRQEELFVEALRAMRSYTGQEPRDDDPLDDPYVD